MIDFDAMRQNMVTNQILTNKVTNSGLIRALRAVNREQFVPDIYRSLAYSEGDLQIAPHRYMVQPMVTSRMIEVASPEPYETVLVIGAGTGYTCALLSFLCARVYGLEEDSELFRIAEAALVLPAFACVTMINDCLENGWPEQCPYNVILVEGSVEKIPSAILDQLSVNNGRLVYFKYKGAGIMAEGQKVTRTSHGFSEQPLFESHVPPLLAFQENKEFCFGS